MDVHSPRTPRLVSHSECVPSCSAKSSRRNCVSLLFAIIVQGSKQASTCPWLLADYWQPKASFGNNKQNIELRHLPDGVRIPTWNTRSIAEFVLPLCVQLTYMSPNFLVLHELGNGRLTCRQRVMKTTQTASSLVNRGAEAM